MAAEAAAALQAAADQLQANMGNKARLTLPIFEGKLDPHATRDFLDLVQGYSTVTRLTAAETAQAVAFAVVPGSPAAHWLTNLKERNPDAANDWARLRPLMQARFCPTLTPSEKAAAADACKQGRHQPVPEFRDICEQTQILLDRDIPNDQKTGANEATYNVNFEAGMMALFLRGLREEGGLKAHTNGAILAANTLANYVAAAEKYERHITKSTKVVVAELDDNGYDDDDDQEIAALKAKQAARRKGGNQKGGAAGRPAMARSASAPPTTPRRCWSCNSSDHINKDCPVRKKNPFKGKTNNNAAGGAAGGGGSGGGTLHQAAIVNEIRQQVLQSFMQQPQALQYDGSNASSHSERFSDVNSIYYTQQHNGSERDSGYGQNFH